MWDGKRRRRIGANWFGGFGGGEPIPRIFRSWDGSVRTAVNQIMDAAALFQSACQRNTPATELPSPPAAGPSLNSDEGLPHPPTAGRGRSSSSKQPLSQPPTCLHHSCRPDHRQGSQCNAIQFRASLTPDGPDRSTSRPLQFTCLSIGPRGSQRPTDGTVQVINRFTFCLENARWIL